MRAVAPLFDELWTDGRTWERPPFRCWWLGHKPIRQFTKDLAWTYERCLRCGVRSPAERVRSNAE